ncbi:PAS domain-containing protein [Halorubrum yunnanense]|uniref:histidine kinase n=1 Tax=Halorubrum yunnanense TaxID=1526162 RepID=A0ABD5YHN4_9EURY|nr:PAS domain-containing protein [Halorubrum yunnanense]
MSARDETGEESIYRRTLDRVTDAVVAVDTEYRFRYLNRTAAELLASDASALLGELIWDAFPGAEGTVAQDRIEAALETQRETGYERYNDSLDRWFEVRVFPDEEGLSILFTDVTERREREERLKRYEWMVENLPVAVAQSEPSLDGELVYVNDGLVEMFDMETKEAAERYSVADLHVDPAASERLGERLRATGEVEDREIELATADGERFWGSVTATVDAVNGDEYVTGVVQDISERKEYERKLEDLHDATREMVAAATPEAVADIVTDTSVRSLGYRMSGVHRYEESVDGLAPESVSEASQALVGEVPTLNEGIAWDAFRAGEMRVYNDIREADQVFNDETGFQSEIAVPIGDYGVFIASAERTDAFPENDVALINVLINNATTVIRQIRTEQTLRERERELTRNRDFLEQTARVAKLGGWEVDLRTDTVDWTEQVYDIHGVPVGQTPSVAEAIDAYHPKDKSAMREAWERLVADGEPYDLELRIITQSNDVRWVRTVGIPEHDDDGDEVVAARGIFQDITENKRRERELEQQNERLDEFASVISHDLQNPLNVAQGRTELLRQADDGTLTNHLTPLADSLDRMETIINDTLTLARKGRTVGEMSEVRVADLAGSCWGGVSTGSAALDVVDEFAVRGDRSRLKHVFENLFRNSVEHGRSGDGDGVERGGDDVTVRVGRADEAAMYVEDDGAGIPPDERDAIFEPGYTTATDGTGFGLAIVRRVAEAHGWEVSVTDAEGGGARFEFDNVRFAGRE